MATKKQMTDTINRVDIIEDHMLKMEEHIVMLKEMISMQNRYIDNMNNVMLQLLHKPTVTDKHEIPHDEQNDHQEKQVKDNHMEKPIIKKKGCPHLMLSRRVT
jgi:hypothetical protein